MLCNCIMRICLWLSYRYIHADQILNSSVTTSGCSEEAEQHVAHLEHVVVKVLLVHPRRGDVEINLISPSGTRSQLLAKRWALHCTHQCMLQVHLYTVWIPSHWPFIRGSVRPNSPVVSICADAVVSSVEVWTVFTIFCHYFSLVKQRDASKTSIYKYVCLSLSSDGAIADPSGRVDCCGLWRRPLRWHWVHSLWTAGVYPPLVCFLLFMPPSHPEPGWTTPGHSFTVAPVWRPLSLLDFHLPLSQFIQLINPLPGGGSCDLHQQLKWSPWPPRKAPGCWCGVLAWSLCTLLVLNCLGCFLVSSLYEDETSHHCHQISI